jgi:protein-tyrosine-phosphatase
MVHILIVCTANICRSPVAAALLRDRLQKRGLNDWQVGSSGTWAMNPRGASQNSIEVMSRRGLDINNHRATMVKEAYVRHADLVLTMEVGHAEALRAEFPAQAHKVYLLSEMVGQSYSIADPYGGPIEEYERMAETISAIIDGGLDQIIQLAQTNANSRLQNEAKQD